MEAVVVEVEETVPNNTQQTKSSRRKRKSPVRSTMADILGEPEFVETFYLEESDNDEGESHGTNVSETKMKLVLFAVTYNKCTSFISHFIHHTLLFVWCIALDSLLSG